jgi:hypothetical protein
MNLNFLLFFSGKIVYRKNLEKFYQNNFYPRIKNFGVDQMNSAGKNHKLRYLELEDIFITFLLLFITPWTVSLQNFEREL